MSISKPTRSKTNHKVDDPAISPMRKVLFYLILAIIPIFLLLLLETSLRLFGFGSNLELFVESENHSGYYEINRNITGRYFSRFNKTSPSNDIFLDEKPENCYRIFVMGSSTTRGFPYTMGMTFSRILHYRLQDAFPGKRIEVINTAVTAVNSNTLLDLIDEILAMNPDAILIYAGHNEYYGALGVASVENRGNAVWIKRLHLSLTKFRTYQLMQKLVGGIRQLFATDIINPTATLMETIVRDKEIPYKSPLYQSGIEQYKGNMDKVIRKIKEAEVPVIFSEVVSNIRGNPPFSSVAMEDYPAAAEAFERACTLEAQGFYDEARKLFYLAKDLDGVRFRAPEDMNSVIHEIAGKYSVPVLGMKEVFENASPNRIIGNSLMTEHLHPNVDGYFLMADAFFNEMRKNRFIAERWDGKNIKPSEFYRQNWGFTSLDSLVADLNIKTLKSGWPFKPDTVINNFIYTYKPVSMVDSIAAMCVLYDDISVGDKHRDLAKIYLNKGDKRAAYNEYYSLIKYTPYNVFLYTEALKILMDLQDYQKALDLMLSMPGREDIFMAEFQIGKIYQQLGEHRLALESFEKARKLPGKDDNTEALLVSQYHSSIALNDSELSGRILNEIRKINPDFQLEDTKKEVVIVYLDKEVRDLIQEAMDQARLQNFNEAFALLEKSLEIKETPFALQLMGSIYFQLGDARALSYLERAHVLDSRDLSTINNLFVLYLSNKDFVSASAMLEEFKLLSPDTEKVEKLSRALDEERKKIK